ncbi:hypothetical protein CYJ10_24420 [Cupriavidus pauculus]|uniref:Uncharacterized protein n=1 Tax=Cupriavidus pauculus TaxID=82633 RepID=A0A2N5C6V5_9BURK|nr:hypothetical protein CYJ10_24420 [Cupriavidus pauculus]
MQARSVTRDTEEDLDELDETDRAIERLEKRIQAQEQRVAQLKREGIVGQSAEQIRVNLCESLEELVRHRALILHDLANGE